MADPAANTLLLNVQALYVRAGIVSQQPPRQVWRRESGPLTIVKDAVSLGHKDKKTRKKSWSVLVDDVRTWMLKNGHVSGYRISSVLRKRGEFPNHGPGYAIKKSSRPQG